MHFRENFLDAAIAAPAVAPPACPSIPQDVGNGSVTGADVPVERDAATDGPQKELADLVTQGCCAAGALAARRRRLRAAHHPGPFRASICSGASFNSPVEAGLGYVADAASPSTLFRNQHREQGMTSRLSASAPAASPSTKRAS
ncbi:hypothetical protein QN219_28435 [Sinorhizobium sp. 7-81]|uniref:hypothetical protein n=1 Tax=Sinorhizobium sp. 8-89 TaxID=3049089 RepID=UPI0024C2607A|nr:hypothetical protein [Sinorhizobium sp. 8-89]MDK1493919.1 hypothetical protein [Sinorhizobium sp. 8-89]